MAATLQDIAVRVGLSPQAVSQAINGTGRLRPATRQHVLVAAQELGYRPNSAARATASGRFRCLALLVGMESMRSKVFPGLLAGIHEGLARDRLNLMLVRMPDELLTDSTVMPRALTEAASDGFLVDYTHGIPVGMKRLIDDFAIPAIWINSKQDHDCVRPDDFGAARAATEDLLKLGHRRIAFAHYSVGPAFPNPHYSVADRREGYEIAMRAAGLEPRVIMATEGFDVPATERVQYTRQWLDSPDRPTAVVCYGSSEAQPVFYVGAIMGLSIPGDLSIVTFGNSPIKWFGPEITIWLNPDHAVGREATTMLLQKIRRPDHKRETRIVPFELYEHGVTCAPPAKSTDIKSPI